MSDTRHALTDSGRDGAQCKIWTIQSSQAWQVLNKTGTLLATTDHQSDLWPEAYGWMRNQLIERLGHPSSEDNAPLWGWVRWGPRSARPDLRTLRWNWHPEGSYVLLECDLPERSLLHSDFMVWHSVLNGSFVPCSEKDEEDADRFLGPIRRKPGFGSVYEKAPQSIRNAIRKSWERIFDFEALCPDYWGPVAERSIQTCFWELSRDQVVSHKSFRSRLSKRRIAQ